jgi:short-subunit dehydrogenase
MSRFVAPSVVLITGASGGIGAALACAYAAAGRTLILQGRNPEKLAQVAEQCRRMHAEVVPLQLDVGDSPEVIEHLGMIADAHAIDLAIVNAGINRTLSTLGEIQSWTDTDAVISVNLRGSLATVSALLPAMRRRGRGQIALVSSLAAYVGMPAAPAYSASKAALKMYGDAMRDSLAAEGIAINVVLPGFVRTSMGEGFPGPHPFMLSPEEAARRIQRGLSRNAAHIAFPFPLSWGMWALSALPVPVAQGILRLLGFGLRR